MGFSPQHLLLFLLVVVLLFGTGRISGVMGDFAKGLKAFKKNMADDSDVSMEASESKPAGSISPPDAARAQRPETTSVPHA